MKKLILICLISFMVLVAFPQTANEQAWIDHAYLVGNINRLTSDIQELRQRILELETKKVEILEDPDRLDAVKVVFNADEAHSTSWANIRINKLKDLRLWLEANNYVQ